MSTDRRMSWMPLIALCLLGLPAAQGTTVGCAGMPESSLYVSTNPSACTSISSSFTSSQTAQTTQVSQRLDQYMTQLTAHLFGGPVVYDHTFNLPYSDPVVQDAILAAQLALQGITSPLGFIGPNLMSNSVGLVGSSSNT